MSELNKALNLPLSQKGGFMKKGLLILVLLTSTTVFAKGNINFTSEYKSINKSVQKVATNAAIRDCKLSTNAEIIRYKLVVDYIDQGVVDSYHTFETYSKQEGYMLIEVFEPLYPTYKDSIKGSCNIIKN